jgi:hypothetical protein
VAAVAVLKKWAVAVALVVLEQTTQALLLRLEVYPYLLHLTQ